jgi:hypothetical protein
VQNPSYLPLCRLKVKATHEGQKLTLKMFSTLGKWKVICNCFEHDLTTYIYTITCTISLFFTRDNFFLCICATKVIPLTTFQSCLLSRTLVGVLIAFSNSSTLYRENEKFYIIHLDIVTILYVYIKCCCIWCFNTIDMNFMLILYMSQVLYYFHLYFTLIFCNVSLRTIMI